MDLASIVASSRTSAYGYVVVTSLLGCDVLSNLSREMKYVWSSPRWSQTKVLYFVVRHYALFQLIIATLSNTTVHTSPKLCKLYFLFMTTVAGPPVLLLSVNIIFIQRLRSLYHAHGKALVSLGILLGFSWLLFFYQTTVVAYVFFTSVISPPPSVPIMGCLSAVRTEYLIFSWMAGLFIQVCIFSMTMWWYKDAIQIICTRGGRLPPLLQSMWRDGFIYFLIMLLGSLFTIIMASGRVLDAQTTRSFVPWLMGTLALSGSRVILNLRVAAQEDYTPSLTNITSDHSTDHELPRITFARSGDNVRNAGVEP